MAIKTATIHKSPDAGAVPAADARARLLSAALRVLHEEGIHALTQTRVAAVAGLRQSHLTYYFPTRIDLLKATVENAAGAVMALVGDGAQGMARNLNDVRDILCQQISDMRMPRLMMAMAVAADEDPCLKAWMAAFDQRIRQFFGAALQRFGVRVSARDLALFHATVAGVALLNYSAGTPESARQARALIKAAFDRVVADAV
jgi:AcrR family transcriptional regulator